MRRLLVVLSVVLVGCSGHASSAHTTTTSVPAPPPTTLTGETPAQAYVRIVGPTNDAVQLFGNQLRVFPANATANDARALGVPLAQALQRSDAALVAIRWPVDVQGDIDKLVAADRALAQDLAHPEAVKPFSTGAWIARVNADGSPKSVAVKAVRARLNITS